MRNIVSDFLVGDISPRLRALAWFVGVISIAALGFMRTATDAEYAFASAVIIPLVVIAWIGGRKAGIAFSLLAAIMWASSDLLAERHFSISWIPYINALTRFATYAFIAHLVVMVKTLLERERELARHDALTGRAGLSRFCASAPNWRMSTAV